MSSTQEVGEIFGEGSGPAHAMLRSPTILIASVGFWGLNILIFRIFRINYIKVLKHDLKKLKDEDERDDDDTDGGGVGGVGGGDVSKSINKASSDGSSSMTTASTTSSGGGDKDNTTMTTTVHDDDANDHLPLMDGATPPLNDAITWNRLVSFSGSLLFLLHFTTYIWMDILGGGFIGAIFSFYGSVITVILLPIPSLQWLRKACTIAFQRTFELINPRCHCLNKDSTAIPRPIPFVDVYFADACCSLSKVFFDMGMLLHMLSHYPEPVPPSIHNIVIPSACAAVPYLIRARQCLVMHTVGRLKNDPKRRQHIQNAIKYSTSLWPLFLSAYQKCIAPEKAEELETLLIVLLVINASYSLYWDIVMDWGMMQDPTKVAACAGGVYPVEGSSGSAEKPQADCTHVLLRPRLRFGLGISLTIVITDAILRFSWTLRFFHALFPSGDAFVLFTQFLEVFRRAIWNLLRVEWENIKQQKAQVEKEEEETAAADDEENTAFLPPASLPMTVPAKRPITSGA